MTFTSISSILKCFMEFIIGYLIVRHSRFPKHKISHTKNMKNTNSYMIFGLDISMYYFYFPVLVLSK